jgi:hypothetical protein
MSMRKITFTSIMAVIGLLLTLSAPTAAAAQTARPPAGPNLAAATLPSAGWLGQCYPEYGGSSAYAGGWCDGNGPDWTYRGVAHCTNGSERLGIARWAGDRRKSWAMCPGYPLWGGLYYYYKGANVGSAIILY